MNIFRIVTIALSLACLSCTVKAGDTYQNPVIHYSLPDPTVIKASDGFFYLYATEDTHNVPIYRSKNLVNWVFAGTAFNDHTRPMDFVPNGGIWAPDINYVNGQYVLYYSKSEWGKTWECGIGVAVADNIKGPYKDALGKPLLKREDCFASHHSWCVIDPAILTDDDGTNYIIWGNGQCYYAKLKDNMIEIDGDIHQIDVPRFTEGPWMHKYNGKYYLTYASEWPEKIAYAIADNIGGPYKPMGIISEIAGNSNTTHPAIVNFKGQWLFFSHNGGLPDGTSYSRSIIAEPMYYNPDGSIRPIPPTAEGVSQISPISSGRGIGSEACYLMVYHKDADHSLHMALSRDGYSWKALNGDKAVVSGDTIDSFYIKAVFTVFAGNQSDI